MKQITFLLILCTFAFEAHTQIENGGFENWESISTFDQPIGHITSNRSQYITNITVGSPQDLGIIQVAGTNGGSAVRFETNIQGIVFPATLGFDSFEPQGETYPYEDRPTQVAVTVRYSCAVNDSSDYIFKFYKDGTVINQVNFKTGGEQLTFTDVIVDLPAFTDTPDAVEVKILNTVLNSFDTWLELDKIEFIGSTEQLPNNSFDDWESVTYEAPVDWSSTNFATQPIIDLSGATQSSDAASGSSSMRLEALPERDLNSVGLDEVYAVSVRLTVIDEDVTSGSPINGSDRVNFMYKFSGAADEFGQAIAFILDNTGEFINIAELFLPATDTWTSMNLPFDATDGESIVLGFIPGVNSDGDVNPDGGSVLYIDDVFLDNTTATDDLEELEKFTAYYNKSANEINIQFSENIEQGKFALYQTNGSQLINQSFKHKLELIQSVPELSAGIYIIDVITPNKRGSIKLFVH